MTSDDTPGTLAQCATCQGGTNCFRERSGTLANAYALGCRSPEANSANNAKARERRAKTRTGGSGGSGGSLPDAWADPEVDPVREPTGHVCACGSPFYWETGRGAQTCSNGHWEHAPGTGSRVTETTREADIAARPDPMAERVARARLRALRETSEQWVAGWINTLGNPAKYDRSQWQQQSRQFAALLRGYIPELREVESETEIADIKAYITVRIIKSVGGQQLRAEYDDAQERMSDDDEYDDDDKYDDESDDQLDSAQSRKVITGTVVSTESNPFGAWDNAAREIARKAGTPSLATPQSIAQQQFRMQTNPLILAIGIASNVRQRRQESIETSGACQFAHKFNIKTVAMRLYGIPHRMPSGEATRYVMPGTPQYSACSTHYADAVAKLIRGGYKDIHYWELPIEESSANGVNGLPW